MSMTITSNSTPEVVVIAGSSKDVAEVMKFVRDKEEEHSVRSGGHSYACTSRVTKHKHISIGHADRSSSVCKLYVIKKEQLKSR